MSTKRHWYAIYWYGTPWTDHFGYTGRVSYYGTAKRFETRSERDNYVANAPFATTATYAQARRAFRCDDVATNRVINL